MGLVTRDHPVRIRNNYCVVLTFCLDHWLVSSASQRTKHWIVDIYYLDYMWSVQCRLVLVLTDFAEFNSSLIINNCPNTINTYSDWSLWSLLSSILRPGWCWWFTNHRSKRCLCKTIRVIVKTNLVTDCFLHVYLYQYLLDTSSTRLIIVPNCFSIYIYDMYDIMIWYKASLWFWNY